MGTVSTPTTSNTLANIADGAIKAAISGGDVAVEAYLTAQFTFLGNPILAFILDEGVTELGSILQQNIVNIVNNVVIDIQTNQENSSVLQAAQAFQKAQSSNDLQAQAAATAALVIAYGNLVHSDGVATG